MMERTGLRFSGGHRSRRRWRILVALAAVLVVWQPAAEAEIHPFYREALRVGAAAYDRGEYAAAAERLRVASFGMLEEPKLLVETLARLALAQEGAGQRDDFLATFDRISRAEEGAAVYSKAPIPAALKTQFEEAIMRLVPATTLEQSTAFAKLYRRQESSRLQNMLPGARVTALEQIVAKNPGDLGWQLMLATARIEDNSGAAAIPALESMAADRPEDPRSACLLGRAYLQAARCDAVLQAPSETVHRCDVRRLPTAELIRHLECLTDAERWLEAASVISSLPAERRTVRPFPNWEKRVAKRLEPDAVIEMLPPYVVTGEMVDAEADEVLLAESGTARTSGTAHTAVPNANPEAKPPAGGQLGSPRNTVPPAEMSSLHEKLSEALTVSELQEVARVAVDLNRRYPHSGSEALDVAGEAAYRASQWQLAAQYLRASGGPPDDRFDLLFYLSVSLYESGDLDGARRNLSRALPGLERTPLVERYREEILGSTR